MLTCRRGSPLLMGVRSDHKLSADHIPVLYRSCKFKPLCLVYLSPCHYISIRLFPFIFFYHQLRTRRAALHYPGQPRTPASSLWMRKLWSTTLPLMQGKQKPAPLHLPFLLHSNMLCRSRLLLCRVNQVVVVFGPSVLSQQRSD